MSIKKGRKFTNLKDEQDFYTVSIQHNVKMKTRDGTVLASDIYAPIAKQTGETFPVLLSTSLHFYHLTASSHSLQ